MLTAAFGAKVYDDEKIKKLHRLGYLPIEVRAVPEGTRTAIGVPQSVFINTHPDFAWLTNALETMYSCYMWHTQVSAEVGFRYRKIVDKYRNLTCDDNIRSETLLGDFSMRGQHSVESATKSSAAWLLSFVNTATVPAIMWLEDNYNCDCTKEEVGYGAVSTEHSVMCSNYAVDGDEITHIKRMLTEIYSNTSFSMVSDSYDYENLVENILPKCYVEIMTHKGTLAVRGDSGDPVEVIAGIEYYEFKNEKEQSDFLYNTKGWLRDYFDYTEEEKTIILKNFNEERYTKVFLSPEWISERGGYTDSKYYIVDDYDIVIKENYIPTIADMGTVWALDKIFGHTINSKGYKVLDSHIKALYGDSITPQRCQMIYERLKEKGYAINNVTLGVGSFSFMCLENIDEETGDINYSPYTRDTFGIAIKATYGEDTEGNPIMIYKQPKALSWKKSQKGCCIVAPDGQSYTDGHTWEEACNDETNLLQPVFRDGKFIKETNLKEIRERLYGNN